VPSGQGGQRNPNLNLAGSAIRCTRWTVRLFLVGTLGRRSSPSATRRAFQGISTNFVNLVPAEAETQGLAGQASSPT
jgi:hypothetical protein